MGAHTLNTRVHDDRLNLNIFDPCMHEYDPIHIHDWLDLFQDKVGRFRKALGLVFYPIGV